MNNPAYEPILVSREESGQKLMQYLQRRLGLPSTMLHRLIRSGQVRVNGKRVQAFVHVCEGDMVRVPPQGRAQQTTEHSKAVTRQTLIFPPIVYEDSELLVIDKPAGLPVQPGSGHSESVVSLLEHRFSSAPFMPTPAHRLDKATSGLLLIAKSYGMLQSLHEALRDKEQGGELGKEYLCWVDGVCEWKQPQKLEDWLDKGQGPGGERMRCLPPQLAASKQGQHAVLWACLLGVRGKYSLLHVRLGTGRKHQIRVQLAARGLPLVGDPKYGGPKHAQGLLLHAARISLVLPAYSRNFETLPPWKGEWSVTNLPVWAAC